MFSERKGLNEKHLKSENGLINNKELMIMYSLTLTYGTIFVIHANHV